MTTTMLRAVDIPATRAASGLAPIIRTSKPRRERASAKPSTAATTSGKTTPRWTTFQPRSGRRLPAGNGSLMGKLPSPRHGPVTSQATARTAT